MTGHERRTLRRLVDAERRKRVTPPSELIGSRVGAIAEIALDAAAGGRLLALDLACEAVRTRQRPRTPPFGELVLVGRLDG